MNRRHLAATAPILLGLMGFAAPTPAEAQVAYAPGVGTIPDGVSLSATPVVSADRRYVRLSVNASFTTVDGFQTVGIPFAVSGMGSGSGPGAGGGAGGLGEVLGAPMGMNGPATGAGPAAAGGPVDLAAGFPSVALGAADASPSFASADGSDWSPNPRRTRAARNRATRAKKTTPARVSPPPTPPTR